MSIPCKRILAFTLVFSILISSYMTLVQVVNALRPDKLLKSLDVKSLRELNSTNEFVIGDTLEFKAECELANAYGLRVYQNSSLIFEVNEKVYGSLLKTYVPLNPPTFNATGPYIAILDVHVYNYPIPGAYFTDSAAYVFDIVSVETQLKLIGEYDRVMRNLHLCANLTDVDHHPIPDEAVDFYLQFNGKRRLTDGWLPIGSAVTNASGMTTLGLALNMPSGNYSMKACHKENVNFGGSESSVSVEISSTNSCEGFDSYIPSETRLDGSFSMTSSGNVLVLVNNQYPYAGLPMNATGRYTTDTPLDPEAGFRVMLFYCDYMDFTGYLGLSGLDLVAEGPPYVYEASLVWSPNVIGLHVLIGGVVVGDMTDIARAVENGTGIVDSGENFIIAERCPSNLVLHHPEAFWGDVLPLTVAFSKPRIYEAKSDSFYNAHTLAPQFTYNDVDYAIDEAAGSVPVKLYVNGTLDSANLTSGEGLVFFPLTIDFPETHFVLNITAVVNGESVIYEEARVEHVVPLTRVDVSDVAENTDGLFKLNFTLDDGSDEVYVGVENCLRVETTLFNQTVCGAETTVISARFVSGFKARMSASEYLPDDVDYVRVLSFYDVTGLEADVNCDERVDMIDVGIVCGAFGSYPGHPDWNSDADVNHDDKVGMTDIGVVCSYYGSTGVYYTPEDVYFVFDSGDNVFVDSQGCAKIPSCAINFTVMKDDQRVGAVIEFFKVALEEFSLTNNLGRILKLWEPEEAGKYLVQVKLPSNFNVTTIFWSEATEVNAPVNVINYFDVVKRPLSLNVTYTPDQPTFDSNVTLIVHVLDRVLGNPVDNLQIEFNIWKSGEVFMGAASTNSSGIAAFSFIPRDYDDPPGSLFPAFWIRVVCDEADHTQEAESSVYMDTRYATKLEFLGSEVMNVAVGVKYCLTFNLTRADNGDPVERFISLYINDNGPYEAETNASGMLTWEWTPQQEGNYFFKARFSSMGDWIYKPSNEVRFIRVAEVVPMNILFDVQPREFKPETNITLTATVLNATSNEPLQGYPVTFYMVKADGSNASIGENGTNASGVAKLTWIYPSLGLGPCAFKAEVATGQQIMSSPVMLMVAEETVLLMDASKEESGFDHTFSGCLLSYGEPVLYRQIKIFVNDSLEAVLSTDYPDGSFNLTLNLEPEDNKPTAYNVRAVFEGDEPCSATAYGYTLNGTEYSVCTTIQYGFKPASNATWLTVTPQSTEVATPTKTPEELQQEAEDSGWLSTWHEFTWWYPWYRLHIKININPVIDVGFNPILPGGETWNSQGLQFFSDLSEEFLQELLVDIIGIFVGYVAAKGLSLWNWAGAALALSAKFILQLVFLYPDWNNPSRLLATAVANIILGFIALSVRIGEAFLDALFNIVTAGAMSALYLMYNGLIVAAGPIKAIGRTWVDGIDALIDFVVAGIALYRYMELT